MREMSRQSAVLTRCVHLVTLHMEGNACAHLAAVLRDTVEVDVTVSH